MNRGPLLTTKEVAERLRSSTSFVRRMALRGELVSIKIGTRPGVQGGRVLIPERAVDEWIARNLRGEGRP